MSHPTAESYIDSIKNPHKRKYAIAFWCYLNDPAISASGPDRGPISYMAAQAVRLSLIEFKERLV